MSTQSWKHLAGYLIAVAFVANYCGHAIAGLKDHGSVGSYGCRKTFGYGVYNARHEKTVVCWNGEKMSISVREYDHRKKEWSGTKVLKQLKYSSLGSYHNYPCITQAPDGHYLIFYCNHSSAAYLLRSHHPNRIDGKWSFTTISKDRCAYPMPVVAGNVIYFFYSCNVTNGYRPYRVIMSLNGGRSWSAPKTVIDSGRRQGRGYDEVYSHGFSVVKSRTGQA